ncbi:MAG: hypothetical protein M3345_07105, partial [Actinomycetota bacterium]|nr:hypothetical protein [Actinomycetota bacterium]
MKRSVWATAGLLLVTGCAGEPSTRPAAVPTGPPEVRLDIVADHTREFDVDVPSRAAGSQEEFAAAAYITGHLQQAGYVVRLDGVPVADLVRSTNVVALSDVDPKVVVAIPYDTGPSEGGGAEVGLF